MFQSFCLSDRLLSFSVWLSVCLTVSCPYLSVCHAVWLYCICSCPSLFDCLSTVPLGLTVSCPSLPDCLLSLSVWLSPVPLCLTVWLSPVPLSVCLTVSDPLCLSVCLQSLFVWLSPVPTCLTVWLSPVPLCLCVPCPSLSVCLLFLSVCLLSLYVWLSDSLLSLFVSCSCVDRFSVCVQVSRAWVKVVVVWEGQGVPLTNSPSPSSLVPWRMKAAVWPSDDVSSDTLLFACSLVLTSFQSTLDTRLFTTL